MGIAKGGVRLIAEDGVRLIAEGFLTSVITTAASAYVKLEPCEVTKVTIPMQLFRSWQTS